MAQTDPIEAALQQLLQERAELDMTIAALQKRVGKPVASAGTTVQSNPAIPSSRPMSEAPVYRGDFFNLSITEAVQKLLRRVGRQLKTPEILGALLQAEFRIKSKTPRATVYTSLRRSRDFVKVAPDTWDLSERHPEAAQMKEQELQNMKTAKTRKRRKPEAKAESEGLRTVA